MIPKPPDSYMLRNIHEVQLPNEVSWFPQTIGWQILFVAVVLFVLYRAYRFILHWWNNRYRKEAVEALKNVGENDSDWPYRLVKIIKVVMVYLDSSNASLHGKQLLMKLDCYDERQLSFTDDEAAQQWLACCENSKLTPPEFEYIRRRLIQWVETHRVTPEEEV